MSEGGGGDAGRLERRARWLLRAYPAAYRADRGEEIIGTLLEAVPPGRDWPPPREAIALIAAGLHARRAANLRQGLAVSLRQVAVAGAAMYLVQLPALGLGAVAWSARRGHLPFLFWFYGWLFYALGGLALVILAAGWSGRRGLVAAGAAGAVIAAVSYTVINQDWHLMVVLADFVGPPVVVFLLFARRRERLPLSLLWLPGLAWGWHWPSRSPTPSRPSSPRRRPGRHSCLRTPRACPWSRCSWPSAGWQPTFARWPASSSRSQ